MVPADMFPRTHQTISNLVFSVYTTLPAESRPKRLWMCFRERLREQKNRASRHPCRQKAHFRQAANHRKTLYSSRFSGFYLLFTFVIKTTHSTCLVLRTTLKYVGTYINKNLSLLLAEVRVTIAL
jgi:hypothetical protein